jgi:RNA polymerase sigma factor (sigma-70 family)
LDSENGGGTRGRAAEELILRTVAAHADSLLRTARRFSLCPDDAQDAYQRALEIFMGHAERLDAARAAGWLHVVVKREAQAIRRSRQKLVASEDVNLDAHEARSVPTPEERLASFDLVGRSAEALQRLKPQELRALWLRAQGHSYNDIGVMTGWSYTKVNRCLTEGRRSFLERYADIESGVECARWLPVISAMVDGEATSEQLVDLRPHLRNCPGCRATLRALQDSSAPLAAVLPIPLAVVTVDAGDHVSNFLTRIYELIAGGLHDRAATSFTKVQAVVETTAAGKAAAIAGAAAAVAGGGYATVERSLVEGRVERSRPGAHKVLPSAERTAALARSSPPRAQPRTAEQRLPRTSSSGEFEPAQARLARTPEFSPITGRGTDQTVAATRFSRGSHRNGTRARTSNIGSPPSLDERSSPEFAPKNNTIEFGP